MPTIDGRNIIPASDLPQRAAGNSDSIVGVVRSDQSLASFPVSDLPTPRAAQAEIDALKAGQQTSAIYADTLSALLAVSGTYVNQGAFVNNGVGAGQYIWDGTAWQFSKDDMLSAKLDTARVPEVQDGTRITLGVTGQAPSKGAGAIEVILDTNGVARIVSVYPDGLDAPLFYGDTPNAWRAPAFAIDQAIRTDFESDADLTELIYDVNGVLRVFKAIGPNMKGPVVFGADIPAPEPVEPTVPTEFVMFLIAGQSNAQGWGQRTLSPGIPDGWAFQYYNGNLTRITADRVGNANSGSAWPAFAVEFYRRTGLGVIFVPTAVGNSGLTAKASRGSAGGSGESQSWSPTGALRSNAAEQVRAAKLAATASGLAWRFGGVLWSQGERDSRCLPTSTSNPGLITEQEYLDTFDGLLAYFNEQFGDSKWPWIMSMTGGDTEGIDSAGLTSMREMQRLITRTRPQVQFGWTGALNLIARGLMRWHDFPNDIPGNNRSHYSQKGYNEMGTAMATVAASVSI